MTKSLMDKKTVTFISAGMQKNGSVSAILNLAALLAPIYNVKITTHFANIEYELPMGIQYIFTDKKRSNFFLKIYSKLKFIYQILKQSKSSNIVICEESPSIAIIVTQICCLLNKKSILWNHSCRGELIIDSKITNFFYKRAYKKASYVVNVSKYAETCLIKYMNKQLDNSLVIYNIIKLNNIINNKQFNTQLVSLISIGTLNRNKNFELLLYSIQKLIYEKHLNIRLTICGSGECLKTLQELAFQLNIENSIYFAGVIHNIYEYILDSDILISSSNSESFSLTIAEALSCSTPVITTNTGAAEILNGGEFGLIVNRNNVEEMVSAILFAINNFTKVKQMAKLGRKSLDKLTIENILPQWLALLKSNF